MHKKAVRRVCRIKWSIRLEVASGHNNRNQLALMHFTYLTLRHWYSPMYEAQAFACREMLCWLVVESNEAVFQVQDFYVYRSLSPFTLRSERSTCPPTGIRKGEAVSKDLSQRQLMSRPLQLQGPEDVNSLWIAVSMNRGPLRIIYEQLRFRGIMRYRKVVVVYPLPKFPRSLVVFDVPRDVVRFSRSRCVFVEGYRSKRSSDGVRPASRGEPLKINHQPGDTV